MRKICVVTGTRAEYGLLTPLMKEIEKDKDLQLQLVVTGTHLSPEFGLTYKEVAKEFTIDKKIEILLSSDSAIGTTKAMGLAQISFGEAFESLQPDIVLVLGDRYEIFAAVSCAMIARIPIAHLSGGELTLGAVDDAIRHAITKMSHLHFVATQEYKQRVIQLGENPQSVFNFGEAGLDNLRELELLEKDAFENSIEWKLNRKNILFTYHPTTLDSIEKIREDMQNILTFLATLQETHIIFTKANADSGGRVINEMLEKFVQEYTHARLFDSLGQLRYLSALAFVDAVVGNTSSGLVEAPSFKIGTINIGERQKGRVSAQSVIHTEVKELEKAFTKLYSLKFQESLKDIKNPYEGEKASYKTKEILKSVDLKKLIHKEFWDIPCDS